MHVEFKALVKKNTWELVPPRRDQHIVEYKQVYKTKLNVDGTSQTLKAKLIAKGFQQTRGMDQLDTFTLVVKPITIRVILTLAVTYQWVVHQIDINNVFLNFNMLEDVYISQPQCFVDKTKPQFVCKLNKTFYVLKQTPRFWFEKLTNALLVKGFAIVVSDSSLFILSFIEVRVYIFIYVDDILLIGPDLAYIDNLIRDLNSEFSLRDLENLSFFLGIEAHRSQPALHQSQSKYATELLQKTQMLDCKPCKTPMG